MKKERRPRGSFAKGPMYTAKKTESRIGKTTNPLQRSHSPGRKTPGRESAAQKELAEGGFAGGIKRNPDEEGFFPGGSRAK